MRKSGLLMALALLAVATVSYATIDSLKKGKNGTRSINVSIGQANTDIALRYVVQVDTNTTTVATAYTPAGVGQYLVGKIDTGTNALWVAYGATTNDWVKVNQDPSG